MYPFVLSARRNLRRRLDRFAGYHERAVSIADALTSVPGISVKPDPPQTHMMHVYLHTSADAALEASVEIARTERVLLFRRVQQTGVPNVTSFELSLGDAVEALSDDEIRDYFARVMARPALSSRP